MDMNEIQKYKMTAWYNFGKKRAKIEKLMARLLKIGVNGIFFGKHRYNRIYNGAPGHFCHFFSQNFYIIRLSKTTHPIKVLDRTNIR
jgi:hypothetical protein